MRSQHFRGNVFVANLPPEFSDDQLAEAFDSFGIVLSASVARDPATGKRLRYGFVDIATERAAKLAVESMNGAAIDGHNLDVRISERPTAPRARHAQLPAGTPNLAGRREKATPLSGPGDEEHAIGFRPRPAAEKAADFSG